MPRKARKKIVGRREDIARRRRKEEYADLIEALRREWRSRREGDEYWANDPGPEGEQK